MDDDISPNRFRTEENTNASKISSNGQTLPSGKFLPADRLLTLLVCFNETNSNSTTILPWIPDGCKDNKYFTVQNSSNVQRRLNGQQSQFVDDCGAWTGVSGGASPSTRFLQVSPDIFKHVIYRRNVYHKEVRLDKKKILVELDPQPNPSDIFQLHWHYSSLKASTSYKRRISWVDCASDSAMITPVCVAEYVGVYPGSTTHGNSHGNSNVYVRSSTKVMTEIGAGVRNQAPRKVYEDMLLNNLNQDAPRD